jgi:DNA-binding response OmpR family regulator
LKAIDEPHFTFKNYFRERPMEKLLIIDDDKDLGELLSEYLGTEGFEIDIAYSGDVGIERALIESYALVILDVMLPGGLNGFQVLQHIRAGSETPILMLTAKGEDIDRIIGLEMGADDYLAKPFNPRELLARIRAILRRSVQKIHKGKRRYTVAHYRIGHVELDAGMRVAFYGGRQIELTSVEFDLLEMLLRNAGNVVSRDELSKEVLDRSLSPYDRSIDVHISKLRKKLGTGSEGVDPIKAIRGVGYFYVMPSLEPGGISVQSDDPSCGE